jgi:hypothetical protein
MKAPLNNLLQGNAKGREPVTQNPGADAAFDQCKNAGNPACSPGAPLAIFTDESDFAIGDVLQQHQSGAWQPLEFSKKNSAPPVKVQHVRP